MLDSLYDHSFFHYQGAAHTPELDEPSYPGVRKSLGESKKIKKNSPKFFISPFPHQILWDHHFSRILGKCRVFDYLSRISFSTNSVEMCRWKVHGARIWRQEASRTRSECFPSSSADLKVGIPRFPRVLTKFTLKTAHLCFFEESAVDQPDRNFGNLHFRVGIAFRSPGMGSRSFGDSGVGPAKF